MEYVKTNEILNILNTDRFITLQCNLNLYLKKITKSSSAFCLCILPDSNDALVEVIDDFELREPLLLPCSICKDDDWESFYEAIKLKMADTLCPFPEKIDKCPVYHPDSGRSIILCCLADCPDASICLPSVTEFLRSISSILITAFNCKLEKQRKEQCQRLLTIAKNLFLHLGDLADLMQEIILEARKLTGAERCSLFLVSDDGTELIAKVFDGVPREHAEEVRIPITEGIAGYVATTGETLNIRDPYHHPLFYKKLDKQTGFTTRNILCFPIRDGQDRVVGVAQLCNKPSGFSVMDEEASAALATYCGISLMHSLVYKKIQQSQARSRLANELLMYHMAVSDEAVLAVTQCPHIHDIAPMLDWRWPCRDACLEDTPCLVLSMFESLGFATSFRMDRNTLVRFILLVRKGYREIPYHNWLHAFSTAHFVYCVMKSMELIEKSLITDFEGVALLVAALCHDLDHRGTTNSFQTKSKNTLACLYSSEGSVMERHHFAQALCILNTEGCNIFEHLDTVSYRHVLDVIRELILATDVVSHLARRDQQRVVAESFEPERSDHRNHLLALIVTCADLSDQIKGWSYTRHIANLIYGEFFAQGDLEKAMGTQPAIMMDRERAEIPVQQVQFLKEICIPSYSLLSMFFPQLKACLCAVEDSLHRWELAKNWFDMPEHEGRFALDMLNDDRLEDYVDQQCDA